MLAGACSSNADHAASVTKPSDLGFESPKFEPGGAVPVGTTCDGDGTAPRLEWTDVTDATEYAVTVTDPDAPGGLFVHWVVWNIPTDATSLPADSSSLMEGRNDFNDVGFGHICPPEGETHTYEFTLYALNGHPTQSLDENSSYDDFQQAIECCVIATDSFTGRYGRD